MLSRLTLPTVTKAVFFYQSVTYGAEGKRLQEVAQQNLSRVHASHGEPTNNPKSSSRKKKAAKDVVAPSSACADGVAKPQERRSRRQTKAEEIPKGSPISLRRTRRMKERKMHLHTPTARVQMNLICRQSKHYEAQAQWQGFT